VSVVAAAVKAKLVGEGNVLAPLLPGVTVAYSQPRDLNRELVYGGQVAGPVEMAAFAGGAKVKRKEDLIFLLHIRIWKPNTSVEVVEQRAAEIGGVITDYLAANWTLGDLNGLTSASVSNEEMGPPWTDDDGAGTELTFAVSIKTYLT
jgi:hypothetical protein